ncbi:tetratricopeptide (TPR) repeat protein [Amycolatopsis bartoniae]|uniref:SARP family transcriptional regulator n=1 Tax=Amycolatopsis bartoniae TaxID=941986 RepID=A0A8H9MDP0_9PSEU|nr:tetratricopeptide repeat protein [Amycolatopsis bartoniae]MBB2936204.1 tetratricopeptide (TPR) repeat protein [Amycolatopsis bartoniae]GHF80823.1 SARP family transcriptional regulator [Amycolatopsis bartoniae]
MSGKIMFGILGGTIVQVHGQPGVHLVGSRKVRQILAVLLAQPGRRISFERLVEWVWPERPPKDLKITFHTYSHRIRKALENLGPQARLITADGGLVLEVEKRLIDYWRFRELIFRARSHADRGEHEEALEHAGAAVALWRDRPLADLDTEPARNWRRHVLLDEWLPANQLLLDEQIALGRYDLALLRLRELEQRHRPETAFAERRLTVLHALGRHSEATAYYLNAYRRLQDEGRDEEARELRDHHERLRPVVHREPPAKPPLPRRLPREVVDFTGRADLLEALDELSGSAVALSGLGGVGKTATAVRWARHTGLGVLFADLRGVSRTNPMEADEVVESFLAQLGQPVEHAAGSVARAEKLRVLLEARPMAVILDNARNSAHVRGLLPLFGSCPVVITSRHRLTELAVQQGIPALTVGPLAPADAMTLLSGRIRGRAREGLQELAELCGGLPLALNLVAERAASRPEIPLRALADQLRDRELLLGIGHDGDGPDASLTAVFTLSYEALPVGTARLFRLLGVHPGAEFGVHAAASLTGEPVPETRRRLDELVGAHLLEQPGEVDRYRMHDLLLAFAAGLAERDPESDQARRRMLGHYLHSAYQAHRTVFPLLARPPLPEDGEPRAFADEADAMRWYRLERANLSAVIRCALRAGLPGFAWPVPHLTAHAFARMGHYADIINAYTAVLGAELDGGTLATTLNDLGHYLTITGDTAAAGRHLRRAAELVRPLGNPTAELTVRINLAQLARREGRNRAAAEMFRECLRLARELGDREREAKAEHWLGEILAEKRLLEPATEHFTRALRLREQLDDTAGQLATLTELCALARFRGRHRHADELGVSAEALFTQVQDVAAGLRLHVVLTELALDRDRAAEAVRTGRRALELALVLENQGAEAEALDLLGRAWLRLGEHEEARGAWERAAVRYRQHGEEWRAEVVDRRAAELGATPVIPVARDTGAGHASKPYHSNR